MIWAIEEVGRIGGAGSEGEERWVLGYRILELGPAWETFWDRRGRGWDMHVAVASLKCFGLDYVDFF